MNRLFLLIASTWHARLALFAALDGDVRTPLPADLESCAQHGMAEGVQTDGFAAGGGDNC